MSRPCRWPDGGCGEPVEFLPTGRTKPDGKPVLQVVDAKPEKRIVVGSLATTHHPDDTLIIMLGPDPDGARIRQVTRAVVTWVDHHATCAAWLAKVERERAGRRAG